ncbi:MAG TPA: hypothetical protein V6D07_08400 [Trichocoleus sp.]
MTTLQLKVSARETQSRALGQKPFHRSLQNRWHHGRAYGVIAAIAPLVILGLLLVHMHMLTRSRINCLR